MEMLLLVMLVIMTSSAAAYYKVAEAQEKEVNRKRLNEANYTFLSPKAFMPLIFFLAVSPLFLIADLNKKIILILLGLSIMRFIPWVLVNIVRGKYQNTKHQASSNFTMLENFAGPLGALLVYGIFQSLTNSSIPIFWYIISPK